MTRSQYKVALISLLVLISSQALADEPGQWTEYVDPCGVAQTPEILKRLPASQTGQAQDSTSAGTAGESSQEPGATPSPSP